MYTYSRIKSKECACDIHNLVATLLMPWQGKLRKCRCCVMRVPAWCMMPISAFETCCIEFNRLLSRSVTDVTSFIRVGDVASSISNRIRLAFNNAVASNTQPPLRCLFDRSRHCRRRHLKHSQLTELSKLRSPLTDFAVVSFHYYRR